MISKEEKEENKLLSEAELKAKYELSDEAKAIRKEYNKAYYEKHRYRINKYQSDYRKNNLGTMERYKKAYFEKKAKEKLEDEEKAD